MSPIVELTVTQVTSRCVSLSIHLTYISLKCDDSVEIMQILTFKHEKLLMHKLAFN